jgi:hypothetical protein
MKCSRFIDLFDDYLRHNLDKAAVEQMSRHADECVACAEELEAQRTLLAMLTSEVEPEIEADDMADFLPAVWEKLEKHRRAPWREWLFRFAPAAVAAVILAFVVLNPRNNVVETTAEQISEEDIYTESGYQMFIEALFGEDDNQKITELEDQLYTDSYSTYDASFDSQIESLDDTGLSLLEEKLDELFNTAG